MRRLSILLIALGAGCASSSMTTGDDARRPDASVDIVDAAPPIDAAPPVDAAPVRPHREIVSAGGRIRAGAITMDVEIGHPVEQSKATAGSVELRGAAVVNP